MIMIVILMMMMTYHWGGNISVPYTKTAHFGMLNPLVL